VRRWLEWQQPALDARPDRPQFFGRGCAHHDAHDDLHDIDEHDVHGLVQRLKRHIDRLVGIELQRHIDGFLRIELQRNVDRLIGLRRYEHRQLGQQHGPELGRHRAQPVLPAEPRRLLRPSTP